MTGNTGWSDKKKEAISDGKAYTAITVEGTSCMDPEQGEKKDEKLRDKEKKGRNVFSRLYDAVLGYDDERQITNGVWRPVDMEGNVYEKNPDVVVEKAFPTKIFYIEVYREGPGNTWIGKYFFLYTIPLFAFLGGYSFVSLESWENVTTIWKAIYVYLIMHSLCLLGATITRGERRTWCFAVMMVMIMFVFPWMFMLGIVFTFVPFFTDETWMEKDLGFSVTSHFPFLLYYYIVLIGHVCIFFHIFATGGYYHRWDSRRACQLHVWKHGMERTLIVYDGHMVDPVTGLDYDRRGTIAN